MPLPNVTLTCVDTGDAWLPGKGVTPMVSCTTLFATTVAEGVSVKRFGEEGGGVAATDRSTASFDASDGVGAPAPRMTLLSASRPYTLTCCASELHFPRENPDVILPEIVASASGSRTTETGMPSNVTLIWFVRPFA